MSVLPVRYKTHATTICRLGYSPPVPLAPGKKFPDAGTIAAVTGKSWPEAGVDASFEEVMKMAASCSPEAGIGLVMEGRSVFLDNDIIPPVSASLSETRRISMDAEWTSAQYAPEVVDARGRKITFEEGQNWVLSWQLSVLNHSTSEMTTIIVYSEGSTRRHRRKLPTLIGLALTQAVNEGVIPEFPTSINLAMFFARADISTVSDFGFWKRKFSMIRRTYTTSDETARTLIPSPSGRPINSSTLATMRRCSARVRLSIRVIAPFACLVASASRRYATPLRTADPHTATQFDLAAFSCEIDAEPILRGRISLSPKSPRAYSLAVIICLDKRRRHSTAAPILVLAQPPAGQLEGGVDA
jgi:hypothetical protein